VGDVTFQVGRIRARYLTVRLPNPPVRTEYAAFTAHGSRNREFMVTSISSGFHRVHGVQLARSLSTVYRFPTLFLRAFAMYVAFPHADYYAQSDCPQGFGRFSAGLPCLLSTVLCIPCRLSRVHRVGLKQNAVGGVLLNAPSPLWGSPVFLQGRVRLTWSPMRSHPMEEAWVPRCSKDTLQARQADITSKVCQGPLFPKGYARFR
jgi:hypothetical protein